MPPIAQPACAGVNLSLSSSKQTLTMLAFKHPDGDIERVNDCICWRALEGRPCQRPADSLLSSVDVVVIPILLKGDKDDIMQAMSKLCNEANIMANSTLRLCMDDDRKKTAGSKFNAYENLGVPIRIEIGPKEASTSQATIVVHPLHSKYLSDDLELSTPWRISKRGSLVISNVPFSSASVVCQRILDQIRLKRSTSHTCFKLHIRTSEEEEICIPHLENLISGSKPCHCYQGHLSLTELKARVSNAKSLSNLC